MLDGGSRFALLAGLVGVFAALVTVVAATASGEVALWVGDLSTVSAAAVATAFCLRARARLHGRVRRFWALPAAASAAWTLAEASGASTTSSCAPRCRCPRGRTSATSARSR